MKNESIKEIKIALKSVHSREDERLLIWQQDQRLGVQQALGQWERNLLKKEKEAAKFQELSIFEKEAKQEGYRLIAGIDEVGRGPLAGPVVAAAVILPEDCKLLGLNDSKQLSAKKREELYDLIQNQAISIGIGMVDHIEIDHINIYQASKKAMGMAIEDLDFIPDYLLIDAMELDTKIPQKSLIKGDARSISIAAASIVAKVCRDRLMEDYAKLFPGYAFEKNAGYGTKEHIEGIKHRGICPIHRKTFAPVKNYCE
ncbi:ribonuclease HII [Enterococcus sp. BWB1-3]|uniref:ribonuclease HII n=1 Tax=unclassified Enterococcus TaxID=2608891 RepID=UPI001922F5D4|nr:MULTISPECIES: ribonuclease HII [unclassified Enterococcus]MBL1230732.1 ribonuclease HII [Enterococcus sp. BWB1-3]MCB5950699.1 ribonuclease HII [Enterococcus sp. BWT-B8]MCB5955934.1 ribonuclease HII [Enterococcus sp. CWB-B31]